MRLRWKIALSSAAAVVALLVAAVFAVPRIIDIEAYKPALIAAVKEATGRELVVDGPMRLRLFPVPGIGAGQVRFSNAVGTKNAQMIDVRWVAVRPSWSALLRGRVAVGQLTFYRPTIVLESDAEGRPNWDFSPGAGRRQQPGAPSAGLNLAVGRLSIVRGTIRYTDPRTNTTLLAEDVRASATVGSLDGPFKIEGKATVNGVPLQLEFNADAPAGHGNDVSFAVQVSTGKLAFTGTASRIAPNASVNGQLRVETGLMTDFIRDLIQATGGEAPVFRGAAVGRFAFDGGLLISPERLAIRDFTMTLGREMATGSLAVLPGSPPTIEGHVSLASLDLEKWLALANDRRLRDLLPDRATPAEKPAAGKPAPPAPPAPQVNASITLDVAKTLYRDGTIRDLSLVLEMRKGVIALPRFKAVLPGELAVQGSSDGAFGASGPKLRETLAWLGVDVARLPTDRLQGVKVDGTMKSTAAGLELNDATFAIDGVSGKGSASLTLNLPLAVTARLEMERLDLDAYLPGERPVASAMPAAIVAPASPPTSPPVVSAPSSFALKAKVARLAYRGETLLGVEADAAVQGNVLKLNDLKVANLLGAKLAAKGEIKDPASAPQFSLTFNATVPDTERLLAYFRLPKFTHGAIGAATASGTVAGTWSAVTLRDVAVGFLGSTGHASGKVAFTETVDFDFPTFRLHSRDMSRLISVAAGRPMAGIGLLSASGSFKGNARRAAFSGNLEAMGVAMSGTVDATLGERPNIKAELKVPGTLDVDRWLGIAPDAGPATPATTVALPTGGQVPVRMAGTVTAKPIDLSALRAFDATLSLRTSAMAIASLRINYADVDATLRNGVFRLSRLTGQFYGGGVDFAGTVDASGRVLALDLKGDVIGIYLGEMLRGMTGDNNFGNDHLTVALDGKLDARGIRLVGQGASGQEIRNGLQGGATLGGFVYPSVIKGSRSFAEFATSVAGIFSTEMAFNSLMLQSFVDRQSAIAGGFQLNGATVLLDSPTVKGQNATATIVSRTDLGTSITDTTVRIAGSDRFVVTVKGPLDAPVMTTSRGR